MPNRILKESICTSPTIESLAAQEEVFFYRLIVNCDDYGRFDANPKILRAKCFPLKIDELTDEDIAKWLKKLSQLNLIIVYEFEGSEYLQMATWEKHQQVRSKRSKFPSLDDKGVKIISFDGNGYQMISDDINRNHVKANVPVIQSNPIQSESESNPNPIGGNEEEDKNEEGEKEPSMQITNLRLRYSESQLKVIDEYFDILRWTRKHGKIADSVILKIYTEWKKFKPDTVIYGLKVYINNPKYHDKRENYCYGIMRNAKDEEVYKGVNGSGEYKGHNGESGKCGGPSEESLRLERIAREEGLIGPDGSVGAIEDVDF